MTRLFLPRTLVLAIAPPLAALGLAACCAASPGSTCPSDSTADAGADGSTPGAKWRPSGPHTKDGAACTQSWTCDCTEAARTGECSASPVPGIQSTTGLCASDSGPADACTRCMALEPEKPCTCLMTCA